MPVRPFSAYRGDGPYVFVSYSHEDEDAVQPEIRWLFKSGINVWYDEELSAGSVWRDDLANAIDGSILFLYFITPHSARSKYCQDEVAFASSHDVPILPVYLEETELTGGVDLTLSNRQAIMRYELSESDYRDKLVAGIRDHARLPLVVVKPSGFASLFKPVLVTARERAWWIAGAIVLLLLWYSGLDRENGADVAAPEVARFEISLPETEELSEEFRILAMSRDGRKMAYVASPSDWIATTQISIRSIGESEAVPVKGTTGGLSPAFSPDGDWLAFWKDRKLYKVSLTGDDPVELCDARSPYGISWSSDNRIIFGQAHHGIFEVSPDGGEPRLLFAPDFDRDEIAVDGPSLLPDGESLLFTLLHDGQNWDRASIVVLRMDTGEQKTLVEDGSDARYVPSGHLLFVRADTLYAQRFDFVTHSVSGTPVPVLDRLSRSLFWETGAGRYAVSDTGTLISMEQYDWSPSTLVWVDREGNEELLALPERFYYHPRLSPDGSRAVLDTLVTQDIWIYEFARGTISRLTTQQSNLHPIWSVHGESVFFDTNNGLALERKRVDSPAEPQRLGSDRSLHLAAVSASPDGRTLAIEISDDFEFYDIATLSLDGDGEIVPIIATPFGEYSPMFSPDGDWLAYVSDKTGRKEVYVTPYPGLDREWLISNGGGVEPMWARDGSEIFYRTGTAASTMMTVPVSLQPDFVPGEPRTLFSKPPGQMLSEGVGAHPIYDVSPDGQRFLMLKWLGSWESPRTIDVTLNWFSELERLVPSDPG